MEFDCSGMSVQSRGGWADVVEVREVDMTADVEMLRLMPGGDGVHVN